MCSMQEPRSCVSSEGSQEILQMERLSLCKMYTYCRKTASHGGSGLRMIYLRESDLRNIFQVALRRQQAQEEAEARQLGVEILKPGDRADLVMGTDGILRREGEHEVAEADTDNNEETPQKKIKVDSFDEDRDQGKKRETIRFI